MPAHAAAPDERRILVIANETVGGSELLAILRQKAEGVNERVHVVCPALNSQVRTWVSDEDGARAKVEVLLHAQSPDIAMGVDAVGNKDEGAGDQGLMFGFACRETPELMPAPIQLAHTILRQMAEARRAGAAPQLGPDAKSQITLRYREGVPAHAASVVVSTQHAPELSQDEVREVVRPFVMQTLPDGWMCPTIGKLLFLR